MADRVCRKRREIEYCEKMLVCSERCGFWRLVGAVESSGMHHPYPHLVEICRCLKIRFDAVLKHGQSKGGSHRPFLLPLEGRGFLTRRFSLDMNNVVGPHDRAHEVAHKKGGS